MLSVVPSVSPQQTAPAPAAGDWACEFVQAQAALQSWTAAQPQPGSAAESHTELAASAAEELGIETRKFEASDDLLRLVRRLRSPDGAATVELRKLHGSYSGALVLIMRRFRRDGRELVPTVLKYDCADDVEAEARLTEELGPKWGAAYPKVQGVLRGDGVGGWGLMQIDLCGSAVGVPGLTREDAVQTMATTVTNFIAGAGKVAAVGVVKALNAIGHGLKRWSAPTAAKVNLSEFYEFSAKVSKQILHSDERCAMLVPQLLPDGVTAGDFFQGFVRALEAADRVKLLVATARGLSHGDLHGGNLLVDPTESVFLIDYAAAEEGRHALEDVGKLLASVLLMYLGADPADDEGFAQLCKWLAAAPPTGVFPTSPAATPHICATEQIVRALWPHVQARGQPGRAESE